MVFLWLGFGCSLVGCSVLCHGEGHGAGWWLKGWHEELSLSLLQQN